MPLMPPGPNIQIIMKSIEFRALVNATADNLLELTDTKGREYANSDDQLANFKRLADQLNLSPAQIAYVYLTKHLDSIQSHIRDPEKLLSEPVESRIDDAILYLILLKALLA